MRKHLPTIFVVLIALTGLSIMLYPTVSDFVNSLSHKRTVNDYITAVEKIDKGDRDNLLKEAEDYNKALLDRSSSSIYLKTDEEKAAYQSILNLTSGGVMGYVEIPSINLSLPIYHGTDENVLQSGVGHIDGSSLPIGGDSTHCLLSAHRGLPSAKLFTNIDKLEQGDVFMLHVLGSTATYQVDDIRTVLPNKVDTLRIEKGKDLCTLITCTPYGVNTHRLLITGKRIANLSDGEIPQTDHTVKNGTVKPVNVFLLVLFAEVIVLSIYAVIHVTRRKRK